MLRKAVRPDAAPPEHRRRANIEKRPTWRDAALLQPLHSLLHRGL